MLKVSKTAFVDMAAPQPAKGHLDCKRFVELQEIYSSCDMIPVHTSDECFEFAKENGMKIINDFDEIIV